MESRGFHFCHPRATRFPLLFEALRAGLRPGPDVPQLLPLGAGQAIGCALRGGEGLARAVGLEGSRGRGRVGRGGREEGLEVGGRRAGPEGGRFGGEPR